MSTLLTQRTVTGIDVFHEPQDLPPNRCVHLDNLICYAGVRKTRPGLQGLFDTPLAAPIWEQLGYVEADKSTMVFFISGGDTDGQLYQTVKGTSTYTATMGTTTNINAPLAHLGRAGSRAYITDRTNPLVSFDTTTGATVYVAEDPPTDPPNPVVLTNEILDGFTSTSTWSVDTFTGSGVSYLTTAQADINATTSGNISGAVGTELFAIGTSPSVQPADGSHGIPAIYANIPTSTATVKWLTLDDPGDGVTTLTGSSARVSPALAAPNTDRTCSQFYVSAYYYTSDTTSKQGLKFTAKAYSDGSATVLIDILTYTFIPTFAGQAPGQIMEHVFSFANLDDNVATVIVEFAAADGNTNAASRPNFEGFVYLQGLIVAPLANNISLTQNANSFTLLHAEPTTGYWGALGAIRLTNTYTADQDWSGKATVAIALSPAGSNTIKQLVDGGMLFKLGFRTNADPDTHQYSNYLTFDAAYSYMYVDITTVDTATIAAFRYLEIISLSDITVTATTSSWMKIGPLTFSGNLGLGLPYYWVFTEVNNQGDITFVGIIESDSSPLSVTLTPTGLQAEASITLPAPVNASTTHYYLYRYGGAFAGNDGAFPLARLIAILPVDSDTVVPAPYSPGADYVTWDHTTGIVIDDTPDSLLLFVPTLITGKTPPPLAPACQASWLGRLCLGGAMNADDTYDGSILSISWLLTASDAGVYFGPPQDPINDPSAGIKGFYATVGGADNDDILALIPFGTVLLIIKERSVWMLTGSTGANFELYPHMQQSGIGIVGARGWANVLNRAWLMTSTGPYRYDSGDDVTAMGQEIEPYIAPQLFSGETIPGVQMQYASMLFAGRRVYLFAPSSADSATNDACYVYDTRDNNQGWVRWTGVTITSGITTAQLADDDEIFLGGYDGQLYQLTGDYDLDKPGGTQSAITTQYLSRGMGQEQDDASYWAANIPSVVRASVQCAVDTTFTVTVQAPGGVTDTQTFLLDQRGPNTLRFPDVSQSAQGDYLQVGVSTASLGSVTIRAVSVESKEGAVSG